MKADFMHNFFENAPSLTIAVIGDLMIDQYIKGEVKRYAPEAPVPVLSETVIQNQLGGAGFVAELLSGYGVKTFMAGVCGTDKTGSILRTLLDAHSVNQSAVITDHSRPTSLKKRFQKQDELLLRVDDESIMPIDNKIADSLFTQIQSIPSLSAIIISDYGKGVVTPYLMNLISEYARAQSIPVIIDPKGSDWSKYSTATIITPNKKELSDAAGRVISDDEITDTARLLIKKYNLESILVTRSEQGMDYITAHDALHQDTLVKRPINLVGAGDHVIAALAIGMSLNQSVADILLAASMKAAEHIEKNKNMPNQTHSNNPWDQARAQIIEWQNIGLKVGFTNGCFDILHAGHVMYLNQARALCDKLVLGLNSDASVRLLKGPTRPINPEHDRADVMMGLKAIDHVVFFGAETLGEDNTPSEVIAHLKPDIFFKGGDYTIDQLPEAKAVLSYGGAVKILGLLDGRSTTKIIEKSAK